MIASLLHRFYRRKQRRHPEVLWYGNETRREIALTFDDGPHPRDTPGVLDVLAKHETSATFFLIGRDVEQNQALVKRIHQGGHQIGIHCYRHLPFPWEHPQTLRSHLDQTRDTLANLIGIAPANFRDLRPPYGLFNARLLTLLAEWNYRLVLWNCIPPHFLQPPGWSVKQIMEATLPGSIIVLHDGHGHGSLAVQILESILPRLKSEGYEFVTIGQMQERKHS
jgi:peptidoglycan/xylan/chitin deacetylase (PgdA/CDA1 family)